MYDIIIIGSGPAGLTASIYASRYKLSNLVIGKVLGGMISLAHKVENYPGHLSMSGIELAQKMEEQAKNLGGEVMAGNVSRIKLVQFGQLVQLEDGQEFEAKTLIIAAGSERKKLGVAGEVEYLGRGVSYCTTCDAPFFRDKTVVVVGGSDAAVSGAIHAAAFAGKVYLVHRRNELRAEPVWINDLEKNPKITKVLENEIKEIKGNGSKVTEVVLSQTYNGSQSLAVDGVFIEIGGVPGSSLAKEIGVELDTAGFIKVKDDMKTNVPGVFAAGDLTDKAQVLVQMTTATAQGAIAAAGAYKFLKGQKAPKILGV